MSLEGSILRDFPDSPSLASFYDPISFLTEFNRRTKQLHSVEDFQLISGDFLEWIESISAWKETYYYSRRGWCHDFSDKRNTRVFRNDGEKLWILANCNNFGCDCWDIRGNKYRSGRTHDIYVFFHYEDKPHRLFQVIEGYAVQNTRSKGTKGTINFLCFSGEFYTKQVSITRKIDCDLTLNYGPTFLAKHARIFDFLEGEQTGLLIFNGEPGTGKTSYIRYLLSMVSRNVLYVSPQLLSRLADPEFLSFIVDYPNAVLVIEDAEEAVAKRDGISDTSVSNLLNLTDGLLGDAMKVKVICTFNTPLKNIDPALLRKGRLALQYEFKRLEIEDSQKLADNLKLGIKVEKGMTLAELYNYQQPEPSKTDGQTIGFK